MNETYEITIKQYGKEYSVKLDHADVTTEEVYEAIRSVLLSSGWHEDSVKQILNED